MFHGMLGYIAMWFGSHVIDKSGWECFKMGLRDVASCPPGAVVATHFLDIGRGEKPWAVPLFRKCSWWY